MIEFNQCSSYINNTPPNWCYIPFIIFGLLCMIMLILIIIHLIKELKDCEGLK